METIDKQALIALIASQAGEGFDESTITDEMINGILIPETDYNDDGDDGDDGTDEGDEGDDGADEGDDGSNDYEEDDDDDDTDLDVSKLTAGERMIYEMYKKEKIRHKQSEIKSLINGSGVGESHRSALMKMVELGASKKEIAKFVDTFKQVDNAESRILGRTNVLPKRKVKKTNKANKKPKVQLGSKEFGELLASMR